MKISDYEKVTTLGGGDKFLVDKPEIGTKTIEAVDMLRALKETIGHQEYANLLCGQNLYDDRGNLPDDLFWAQRSDLTMTQYTPRGLLNDAVMFGPVSTERNDFIKRIFLGSVFTDEQKEEIQRGTFRGLNLGSWWSIGGVAYYCAGFNTYTGIAGNGGATESDSGHANYLPNHIVIYFVTSILDNIDNRDGFLYRDSDIKSAMQPSQRYFNLVAGAFGADWIVPHKEHFAISQTEDGHINGFENVVSYVDLPTIRHLGLKTVTKSPEQDRIHDEYSQAMPLFTKMPVIRTYNSYCNHWTRDAYLKTDFYVATSNGAVEPTKRANKAYVCGYFLLGKYMT